MFLRSAVCGPAGNSSSGILSLKLYMKHTLIMNGDNVEHQLSVLCWIVVSTNGQNLPSLLHAEGTSWWYLVQPLISPVLRPYNKFASVDKKLVCRLYSHTC